MSRRKGQANIVPGKGGSLAPEGVLRRLNSGQMQSASADRRRELRSQVEKLLADPTYLDSVRERIMAGVGGPLEIYFWRLVLGDPRREEEASEEHTRRFEALRADLRKLLTENAEGARLIGTVVTRARRVLPLPALVADPSMPRDEVDVVGSHETVTFRGVRIPTDDEPSAS